MKVTYVICGALCALIVGAVPVLASPTDPGSGDPFELTFNASGSGNVDACTSACTLGPITGTAVTNVSGLGGNGFSFVLPQLVGTGNVEVLNSSSVLVGVLDFIDNTHMDFLTSGNLSNYISGGSVTANTNGSFTYEPDGFAYPTGNQYNGSLALATTTPEPSSLALLGSGVVALAGLVRRRRQSE